MTRIKGPDARDHPHLHALVADGLFDPQGGFHPLPEEIVLWPLEEMFRRRVIAFLVDQELLPRDRAEMLLSWHSGFSLHRASLWPGRLVAKVSFSRTARGPLTLSHYFQLAASHLHL